MLLKVIGTGSTGNCYALINDKEILILDAGIKLMDVKRAIDYRMLDISGVLITHEHRDHVRYAKDFIRNGIDVYTNDKCKEHIKIVQGELAKDMLYGTAYKIGNFMVQAFPLVHDVECCGFLIRHKEIGKLLYITDTEYIPQNFSGLGVNHVLVEANYSKELIDNVYEKSIATRIKYSHMELETVKGFIQTVNSEYLRTVCLCHLSSGTSDSVMFRETIQDVTSARVEVASKGLEIEL